MKITFHVENCKLIHKIPKLAENIEWIRQEYKSTPKDGSGAMPVSRGNIQKYHGMNMGYTVSEIARTSILEYIDEMLTEFDKMDPSNSSTKSSATIENLFNVDEDC